MEQITFLTLLPFIERTTNTELDETNKVSKPNTRIQDKLQYLKYKYNTRQTSKSL